MKLEDCPVEKAKSQLHQQSKTQFNYIPQTSFKICMYLYSNTFVTSAVNLNRGQDKPSYQLDKITQYSSCSGTFPTTHSTFHIKHKNTLFKQDHACKDHFTKKVKTPHQRHAACIPENVHVDALILFSLAVVLAINCLYHL